MLPRSLVATSTSTFAFALTLSALVALTSTAAPAPPAGTGETLLVLHKWAATLGAYDPDTGRRRGKEIPVGAVPHEMVLSSDRRTLYISNYGVRLYTETTPGGNAISIVDLARGAKVGEISLGEYRRPHGIEIGRSGRLYVTCDFPPTVLVIDPAARKVTGAFPVDQKLPHMLAVTTDERAIFVANSGSGSVTVLRLDDKAATSSRVHIAVGGIPMGLALSPDDRRLYATNRDGGAVVVIDTRTSAIVRKIELSGSPARVAPVPGQHLLVATLIDAGDVALIDTDTFKVLARVHVGTRAEGLMVDGRGRTVYVSAQADNMVVKLALPGLRNIMNIRTAERPDPTVVVPGLLSFSAAPQVDP